VKRSLWILGLAMALGVVYYLLLEIRQSPAHVGTAYGDDEAPGTARKHSLSADDTAAAAPARSIPTEAMKEQMAPGSLGRAPRQADMKEAAVSADGGGDAVRPFEVYRPKHQRAAYLAVTLKRFFKTPPRILTDDDANVLYFPGGLSAELADTLRSLDVPLVLVEEEPTSSSTTKSAPPGNSLPRIVKDGGQGEDLFLWQEPTSPPGGNTPASSAVANEQGQLARDYGRLEQEARKRAAYARDAVKRIRPGSPKLKEALDLTRQAIGAAFDARQAQQQAEVQQLRARLESLEKRIRARNESRTQIIERRLEELVYPDRVWQPSEERALPGSNSTETGAAGSDAGVRDPHPADSTRKSETSLSRSSPSESSTRPGKSRATAKQPIAKSYAAHLSGEGERSSAGLGGNPRKAVLDAEAALRTAERSILERDRALNSARERLDQDEKNNQAGVANHIELRQSEADVLRAEAGLRAAHADKEDAQRQLDLAREDLEVHIQLLKLDLASAKARMELASKEEDRMRKLRDAQSVPEAEYDTKRLERDEAENRYRRAQAILELHRKTGSAPSADHGSTAADDARERLTPKSDLQDELSTDDPDIEPVRPIPPSREPLDEDRDDHAKDDDDLTKSDDDDQEADDNESDGDDDDQESSDKLEANDADEAEDDDGDDDDEAKNARETETEDADDEEDDDERDDDDEQHESESEAAADE
jgi:hypothetical protein